MKLQGGVINGPKNPQFVFRSTLTGEIRNEDAELTLNYVDAKGDTGLDLGINARPLIEGRGRGNGIAFRLTPAEPIIAFQKFRFVDNSDWIYLHKNMRVYANVALIKEICPTVPVIMITKSEEENIMDMAIGQKIADYLIKPVNPNQILLSLKKNLHRRDIVSEAAQTAYQQNFGKIGMQINDSLTATDWMELYRRLAYGNFSCCAASSDTPKAAL